MGQPRRDSLTDGLGLPVIYGVVAVQFVQDEDLSPLSELIHGCEQLVDGGHVLLYEGLASANRLIYLFIAATAMAITIGQLQGSNILVTHDGRFISEKSIHKYIFHRKLAQTFFFSF